MDDVSKLEGRTYKFEKQYAKTMVKAEINFLAEGKASATSVVDDCGPSGVGFQFKFVGSWGKAGGGVQVKFASAEISRQSKGSSTETKKECKQCLYFESAADESLRLVFNNDPIDADLESMALGFGEKGSIYVDKAVKEAKEQQEAAETRAACAEVEARQKLEKDHWNAMSNLSPEQQEEMAKASRKRSKLLAKGESLDFSHALQSFMHHQKENKVTPGVQKTCLGTIAVYIRNIIEKPWEPKFQHINCKNQSFQKRVSSLQGAVDILKACGFVQIGDALVLDPNFLQTQKMALLDAKTKLEALR